MRRSRRRLRIGLREGACIREADVVGGIYNQNLESLVLSFEEQAQSFIHYRSSVLRINNARQLKIMYKE